MDELYYSHPVQVKYWDVDKQLFVGGIGYHDFIISGIDGSVSSIAEIIDQAMKNNKLEPDDAIIELDWLSLEIL